MAEQNYKVYEGSGIDSSRLEPYAIVLDTGAGTNFIRRSNVPEVLLSHIRQMQNLDLCDASNRPVSCSCALRFVVQLNTAKVVVGFVVCERLVIPVILGADFLKNMSRPYTCLGQVDLEDGTLISIVRRLRERCPPAAPLPPEEEYECSSQGLSSKLKVDSKFFGNLKRFA